MKTLDDDTFEKTLNGTDALVVMFTAAFAGPCRLAMPTYVDIAEELKDVAEFATFDLDGNPNIPEQYGVRHVPLFMLFVNGEPADLVAGAVPAERLKEMISGVP